MSGKFGRRTADETIEIDDVLARLVERTADYRIRADGMEPHSEHTRVPGRRFDDRGSGLQARECIRRATLSYPIPHEVKSIAELDDQVEETVGEVPLTLLRDRAFEVPDRLDQAGQAARMRLGQGPAVASVRHDIHESILAAHGVARD